MKLFACMCNQPQRLAEALAPVRAALVAPGPVSRWGMGYIQGDDALLVRTPRGTAGAVDLSAPLFERSLPGSDYVIAAAVRDTREGAPAGPDNTPPFRFRRWMYAQTGEPELGDAAARLHAGVPEYLRRNLKGRTAAELIFHLFLAALQDTIDEPSLAPAALGRALGKTLARLGPAAAEIGGIALTNGRAMVCARLSTPLRLRRLTVLDDRGERDAGFRGVLIVGSADVTASDPGDGPGDGFEDIPPQSAVLISRDLQFQLAEL